MSVHNKKEEQRVVAEGFPISQEQPIRQSPPTPLPAPQNILYLNLVYHLLDDGSVPADGFIPYDYGPKSGVFPLTGNIANFLALVQAGKLPNPQPPLAPGKTPQIGSPAYVVYSIDQAGPGEFRTNTDAAATDDTTPYEYYNLIHYLDDTTPVRGNNLGTISSTSRSKCHIVYFSAISPSAKGKLENVDKFNFHVNVKQADGTIQSGTIDPDIKNNGQPPNIRPFG